MKLKEALKKFNFLKRLNLPDEVIKRAACHLNRTLLGDSEVYFTPFAIHADPYSVLAEWEEIFNQHLHIMNVPLLELERSNRSKFGPRSIAIPWSERICGLRSSYQAQVGNEQHVPHFKFTPGDGTLEPISSIEASLRMKGSSSSGLPFLVKKRTSLAYLMQNFDEIFDRKDPCMLYTRTTECKKTRNVWGYPLADTLYEMMFYAPLLVLQKQKSYRASLVSPDMVAQHISVMIHNAIASGKVLYSVDFAGFDASILHQYIILSFDYIKSCFAPAFHVFISYVCERMYTIAILTPSGIYRGKHGVPSGSTFTNEVDSIVQLGIASTCSFIHEHECQIQGDDGVYTLFEKDIPEFEAAFDYAKLKLEKSKSKIASNYVLFCQNLYHIDYSDVNGHIGGIYPTYRAINRILFQERFIELGKIGITSKDYFGIRCLTILENCKYHPLFEELVRFVLSKEKQILDISDDGLLKYCTYLNVGSSANSSLNHQYGSMVSGIRNFAAYKLATKILAEEELV